MTFSSGASPRQLKAGELVKRVVSDALLRGEVRDVPALDVTVSEVKVSPDLRHATVYVFIRSVYAKMKPKSPKNILAILKAASPHLRRLVAAQMTSKVTPSIRFLQDDRAEHADKISRLIDEAAAAYSDNA